MFHGNNKNLSAQENAVCPVDADIFAGGTPCPHVVYHGQSFPTL